MLAHLWTKLFSMGFPLCQGAMQDRAEGVVCRLSHLSCGQAHADIEEVSLNQALQEFQRRHSARHGHNRLLPAAVLPHAEKGHRCGSRRTIATSHAPEAHQCSEAG